MATGLAPGDRQGTAVAAHLVVTDPAREWESLALEVDLGCGQTARVSGDPDLLLRLVDQGDRDPVGFRALEQPPGNLRQALGQRRCLREGFADREEHLRLDDRRSRLETDRWSHDRAGWVAASKPENDTGCDHGGRDQRAQGNRFRGRAGQERAGQER